MTTSLTSEAVLAAILELKDAEALDYTVGSYYLYLVGMDEEKGGVFVCAHAWRIGDNIDDPQRATIKFAFDLEEKDSILHGLQMLGSIFNVVD